MDSGALKILLDYFKKSEPQEIVTCPYCKSKKSLILMPQRNKRQGTFFCIRCKLHDTFSRLLKDIVDNKFIKRIPQHAVTLS